MIEEGSHARILGAGKIEGLKHGRSNRKHEQTPLGGVEGKDYCSAQTIISVDNSTNS
jgi:hypothetical protein